MTPDPSHGAVPDIRAAVRADRAVGAVLASACGDALGAAYEFGPPLPADRVVDMVGGGSFGWEPGEWTDDTQMALAVLTALADGDDDPVPAIEAGFRAWFDSGPADVGNQTAQVLRCTGPLADAAAQIAAADPDRSGNGSLMRTGPVALAHPGDPAAIAALAHRVSALTHATDDTVDACVLWSVAIDHAIHRAPLSDQPYDWAAGLRSALPLLREERQARWAELIDAALTAAPEAFPQNGWVVHAFQAALAAIVTTRVPDDRAPCTHLQLALARAVRAGGDTDTVAAIAGSLLGARWGSTAIPLAWRRLLHGRRTYDQPVVRAADLERLARLAARQGRPDAQGWPTARTLVDYYAREYPQAPRRVELEGVEFGNVAAVEDAVEDDADVVVSLCRMGTDDVPTDVEHHVLGMLDSDAADNPNLGFLLTDLVTALDGWRADGRKVFVHCVQAENRTPTVAIAWLRHTGVSADDALARVTTELNRPKRFLVDAALDR